MIISSSGLLFAGDLSDVAGETAFGFSTNYIAFQGKGFSIYYQFKEADGNYGFFERSCSLTKYAKRQDGTITCSKEYHLGKTVLMLDYVAPKMAHKVDGRIRFHYLTPKRTLKRMLRTFLG